MDTSQLSTLGFEKRRSSLIRRLDQQMARHQREWARLLKRKVKVFRANRRIG